MIRVLTALALMTTGAVAETQADCTGVENDVARLACYDQAAPTVPIVREPPRWQVSSEEDPITDAVRTTISVDAIDSQDCTFSKVIPRLELICAEHTDTWFVRVRQNCGLGFEKEFNLLTRHDKDEPLSVTFTPAAGRDDVQVSVATATRMIGRLINSSHFLVRIEPAGNYPEVIDFPVSGLAAAITESGAGCKL